RSTGPVNAAMSSGSSVVSGAGINVSRSISWVRRPIAPIGIDLGTRFVRMLQVARHKGQITVTACAQREIPAGAHSPAELAELHVQAVRALLAGGAFVGREAVVALSWNQLHLKNVRIPPMPEEDMAQAVHFEAADRFGL